MKDYESEQGEQDNAMGPKVRVRAIWQGTKHSAIARQFPEPCLIRLDGTDSINHTTTSGARCGLCMPHPAMKE
jgi:hypothetical protein